MALGIIMLAHNHLRRAAQFATALARDGCKVVIHVDGKTPDREFVPFARALSKSKSIVFAPRVVCGWGAFSLTEASLTAAEILLRRWPDVRHVCQVSGACLPLRPIPELRRFLERNDGTDFVESFSASDSRWVKAGLSGERFSLYFPFSWRDHRRMFNFSVAMQRRLGIRRNMPEGLEPHIGSQWWCISRTTLAAILTDPERTGYDRYFRRCWIPDESYFQTLVRKHGQRIECHSLTLSRFDHHGKPHIFYDDHEAFLAQSDRFFARKIWHGADHLYKCLLSPDRPKQEEPEFNPPAFESRFRKAAELRNQGRTGLQMQSRHPCKWHQAQRETARSYAVFTGFDRAYLDFSVWLAKDCKTTAHGRLFRPGAAEFSKGAAFEKGCLPPDAGLRDYRPDAFLANLIWNRRSEHQSLLFEPGDGRSVGTFLARDHNAQIFVITGAWLVELAFRGICDDSELKARAARHQAHERDYLEHLNWNRRGRTSHIWTLGEALRDPYRLLSTVHEALEGRQEIPLLEIPRLRSVGGLDDFARRVRNLGIDLSNAGELGAGIAEREIAESAVVRTGG